MCGIGGWIGSLSDGHRHAERMASRLRHRGPDGQGVRVWPDAALVHTRLSIIDLSPGGAQPMSNEDGTVWVVFNGEIYNHRELRDQLARMGHRFQGYADSEILPHLYEEEGPAFVSRLHGMFALAIHDTREKKILLARDRFGIKPLFYACRNDCVAFASELRALLELPGIDRRPDRQGISDYAAMLFIPAPQTLYTGVRALQPGEIFEAQLDGRRHMSSKTRTYHSWSIAPDPDMTVSQATDQAEALLREGVRRQLHSDVPLGALLSGGIDSSLVSAAAQASLPGTLQTFNVQFPEREFDETWAALAVAYHIRSRHTTLRMEETPGTWDLVSSLLIHAGQPFADTSVFATHAVCRLMRRHVTVALSGDGGDELFGGYDTFWHIARVARFQLFPRFARRAVPLALTPVAHLGWLSERLLNRVKDLSELDDVSVIQTLCCWIRDREHAELCRDHEKVLPVRRWFEPHWEYRMPQRCSRLERLSGYLTEIGMRVWLPNDYLFKVDIASMKESLEVRVPMLDEDLVDFSLRLPQRLKVKGRTCKTILRAVADRMLPPHVARKPKWGFGVPVDQWVTESFKRQLHDALSRPTARLSEFFRPEAYRPLVEAFCSGRALPDISRQGLYQRVIMLLSLELALQEHCP